MIVLAWNDSKLPQITLGQIPATPVFEPANLGSRVECSTNCATAAGHPRVKAEKLLRLNQARKSYQGQALYLVRPNRKVRP